VSGLLETYRGVVLASECDTFGHLNIAYYVERFADAAQDFLARRAPGLRWRTLALSTRYEREYRAGEGIVVESGLLGVEPTAARIAHRATSSATGERTTLAEHVLAPAAGVLPALGTVFAWETPPFAPLELPAGNGVIPSGRDRVKAAEADDGQLSLLGFLQRFSGACMQVIEAIGMDEAYRRAAACGFSTIETRLAIEEAPALGEGVVVASDILSIGTSSLRMVHRMRNAADGRPLAHFYQAGVQLDLAARRPSPWPNELREKATSLRIA